MRCRLDRGNPPERGRLAQQLSCEGEVSMKPIPIRLFGGALALAGMTAGAAAQTPYANDMACRQYADQQTAALRAQASQAAPAAVGSTLLGAGLGAALGAAVGGGRGAAIGAASGAVVGTGAGVANAQNADAYYQQQYAAYYQQCMASRSMRRRQPAIRRRLTRRKVTRRRVTRADRGACAGPRCSPPRSSATRLPAFRSSGRAVMPCCATTASGLKFHGATRTRRARDHPRSRLPGCDAR
jgi:uncharacterized protein YcfJ